jgi:predicted phage terminase large subunit-like protein
LAEIKLAKLLELKRLQGLKAERDRLARINKPRQWQSPLDLATDLDPAVVRTPALNLINEALVQAAHGTVDRLMISVPPQEGKSTTVSRWFPTWLLSQVDPDTRCIMISYSDEIARRWGSDVKRDFESFTGEDGSVDLGVRLRSDSRAAGRWQVEGQRGGMFCAGVAGSTTGRPCDLMIIDDPIKDLEQAQSPTYRERFQRFWQAVAVPRLGPGARVVLVQCVVASERVLNGNGRWTAIEDMRPGDTVASLSTDGQSLVTSKVLGQRMSGWDETVTVKTDRLSLKVNKAHPFAVLNRASSKPRPTDIEWVQAGDITPGDIVVTAKALPDDHQAADVLPDGSGVTAERAWLLGHMLGDGWVTVHRRKNQQGTPTSYAVCCAQTKSHRPEKADVNDRVYAVLAGWSPNRVYVTGHGYWRTDWNAGGRLLAGMGYANGARGKRVPDVVWSWSVELRRAFLKGYAEADGHLANEGTRKTGQTWRCGSVNREMLMDLRDLALTCGVRPTNLFGGKPTVYQPPNSPEPVMSTCYLLNLTFMPDVPEGCGVFSQRAEHPAPRHLRYERVRAIEPGPTLPVYDLMVEGTETFVAEGFITHNTRWHEQDAAGWLLEHEGRKEDGGRWTVINIPAQAEDGEPDPLDRAPGEYMISARGNRDWAGVKKSVGSYVWAALYQGRPAPAEGGLFKRLWWRYFTASGDWLDLGGRRFRLSDCWRFATVDLAASTRTSADYTVIAAWARTVAGDLVLLDLVRAKIGEDQHFAQARPLVQRWNLDTVFVEASQYGTTLVREATHDNVPISPIQAEQDKFSRALPYSAWVSSGRVWLPAGSPHWLDAFITEHASFPAAAHDDTVDVGSMAVRVAVTKWAPSGATTLPTASGSSAGVDLLTAPM